MRRPRKPRNRSAHCTYSGRNAALKRLGFKTYDAYLESDLWARIRSEVLQRDKHTCKLCGKPATQVHHLSYHKQVLLGYRNKALKSICENCHKKIEFRPDGLKRSFRRVQQVFNGGGQRQWKPIVRSCEHHRV